MIGRIKKDFDFYLIDGPAGIDRGFKFSIAAADRVIVVTTPHISAIRDAGILYTSSGYISVYRTLIL